MANITEEEFQDILENCNWKDNGEVSKLVTASYTNVKFNEQVIEKHVLNPVGAMNYFEGFFGTDIWPDGQGTDEIREFATDPYIPYSYEHFIRRMQICDPSLANECDMDYCQIPEGGRGTLPGIEMYAWGFQTQRDCIKNIRSIRDFQYWAGRVIAAREAVDNQVMNMFYSLAAIRTAGHKVVLQGKRDENGRLVPIASSNPRNALRAFSYNYMEKLFPAVTNPNDIMPLSLSVLDRLARTWTNMGGIGCPKPVATGDRGQFVWEIWYGDDFYGEHYYNNADYFEKIKMTMPAKMFAGYSLFDTQTREVLGNWVAKPVYNLPRFTESTEGGIIPVDSHENVPIEVGYEPVMSEDWENAAFGLFLIPSAKQGSILKRPILTKSGQGIPIMPTGDGQWRIRNDFDKACNYHRNKPYSEKDYEMGFRMDNPDGGYAGIYRRRVFRIDPANECNLAPIIPKAPTDLQCDIVTIGCGDNKKRHQASITQTDFSKAVLCTAIPCGTPGDNAAPYLYRVKIEREGNKVNFDSLGCVCGSTITILINDGNGAFARQQDAVLKDNSLAYPYGYYWIELTTKLADGECIKGIICQDDTPDLGNVVDGWDNTMEGFEDIADATVRFLLDSALECDDGDDVVIRYYDENNTLLDTVNGTISIADPAHYLYDITSAEPDWVYNFKENQVKITVTCD